MLITPSAIAMIVATAFVAVAAAPSRAADLSIAPKAGKQANHKAKGQAAKTRRNDKDAVQRIVTYNLYQDPVFKLAGAVTDKSDKTPLGFPAKAFGHAPLIQASPAYKPSGKPSNSTALKLQEPESAGIDFGCRDKPFRSSLPMREVTACYKHTVDRSWKTQTYLSHQFIDGSQKWGGGLAVRYAY